MNPFKNCFNLHTYTDSNYYRWPYSQLGGQQTLLTRFLQLAACINRKKVNFIKIFQEKRGYNKRHGLAPIAS